MGSGEEKYDNEKITGAGMNIGNRIFDTKNHTYIMGILNVTPDSFSDGGKFDALDKALYRAEEMIRDGADIIDAGGESTRPGYEKIAEQEEITRVIPVIEALKKRFDVPVSIDTYKSEVAKAALSAGADLVNDIWGLKHEFDGIRSPMAEVIAGAGVPCCLMHNRTEAVYEEFMSDVLKDMQETLAISRNAGIRKGSIILDPGVGFAKSYEQNLQVIRDVDRLQTLGCPVLLGTSRKSVIGLTLGVPAQERTAGTAATTVYGVMKGCAFVRVHDIKANKHAIQMSEAIVYG